MDHINIIFYVLHLVEPYIEIENIFYNVTTGGNVYLECRIQAYPFGVYYWQVDNGTIYEESSGKVQVDFYHKGLYEVRDFFLIIINHTTFKLHSPYVLDDITIEFHRYSTGGVRYLLLYWQKSKRHYQRIYYRIKYVDFCLRK